MTVARVVLSGTLYGQLTQNSLFFERPEALWPNDGNTLAAAIRDIWVGAATNSGINDRVSTAHTWNLVQVYNCNQPGMLPVSLPMNKTGSRSGANTTLNPFACYVLQLRTGVAGKKGRGRSYIPAPEPGAFVGGIMAASHIAIWQVVIGQLAAGFMGDNPSSGWNLVVANHKTPTVDRFTVISLQIANKAGCQRRRNIGVGV